MKVLSSEQNKILLYKTNRIKDLLNKTAATISYIYHEMLRPNKQPYKEILNILLFMRMYLIFPNLFSTYLCEN